VSRERARDEARFEQQRRDRLAAAGVAFYDDEDDRIDIAYLPREIVTLRGWADVVERELGDIVVGRRGRSGSGREDDETLPVVIELNDDGTDCRQVIRALEERRTSNGEEAIPVTPNFVLSLAQRPKIGPGSDPWPAEPEARGAPGPAVPQGAPSIAVVDTGMWKPIPSALSTADTGASTDEDPVDTLPPDKVVDYPGGGHGGFIAGVVSHTAQGATILSRRAYRTGTQEIITEDTVVDAVNAAVDAGARIINLSLGTYSGEILYLRDAVREWVGSGCLIVAAAGNDQLRRPWFPAGFAADPQLGHGVVSVGALESRQADGPGIFAAAAPFSNRGDWITAWAPGSAVVSEYPLDHKFEYGANDLSEAFDAGLAHWDGTSFAAPFVAAEIARFAATHDYQDVQKAWTDLKGDSPFVVFWPTWDERRSRFDPDDPEAGRVSKLPGRSKE
jgi:Subtilase family